MQKNVNEMYVDTKRTHFAKFPVFPKYQNIVVVPDETKDFEVIRKVLEACKLNEDWDESFFVGDIGRIFSQVNRFRRELSQVTPFYAVKANPLQPVIRVLASLGFGFDCSSKTEIALALKCGVDPNKIIFANPCKNISHVCYAREKGVYMMTLDCEEELLKIKKYFPEARLVVRLQIDRCGSMVDFGEKFGASLEVTRNLIRLASDFKMNMIGVSFHIGSGCPDPKGFHTAIKTTKQLFTFAKTCGYNFDLLDIGGGFPGTEQHSTKFSFEIMAEIIRDSIAEHFPQEDGVRIIAEPGRFFPASAYSLVSNVISKKPTFEGMAYCTGDGLRNSFLLTYWDVELKHPLPLHELSDKSEPKQPVIVYGQSMWEEDVITADSVMREVDVGDWIVWKEMGCYSVRGHAAFDSFLTFKANHFVRESDLRELLDVCEFPELLPELVREERNERTNDA